MKNNKILNNLIEIKPEIEGKYSLKINENNWKDNYILLQGNNLKIIQNYNEKNNFKTIKYISEKFLQVIVL